MLNNLTLAIAGNLTADPVLRYTQAGKPVCSFTIAHTPRIQRDGEWQDGTATFLRCDLWGPAAENEAESFTKGTRCVAIGTLRTETWTDEKTNEARSAVKLSVDEIGASVQYATVQVRKASRANGDTPPVTDPWSGEVATESARPVGA